MPTSRHPIEIGESIPGRFVSPVPRRRVAAALIRGASSGAAAQPQTDCHVVYKNAGHKSTAQTKSRDSGPALR